MQLNEATLAKIERTKPTYDKEAVEIIEQVMLLSKREDRFLRLRKVTKFIILIKTSNRPLPP